MRAVRIAVLFPELLGTYGDGGNAVVLARRLQWRGIPVETVTVKVDDPVPDSCDLYLLGGGEDGPQTLAVERLGSSGGLERAVSAGAVVLAVCAGFQILGHSFPGADGTARPGLGLLGCSTERGRGPRRIGEVVVEPDPVLSGAELLTGYENHGGVTRLEPGLAPLGRVISGRGNDSGDRTEGAVSGRIVGTYLHGPVLARNPALADLLLGWVVGAGLEPLDRPEVAEAVEGLRADRLSTRPPTRLATRLATRLPTRLPTRLLAPGTRRK